MRRFVTGGVAVGLSAALGAAGLLAAPSHVAAAERLPGAERAAVARLELAKGEPCVVGKVAKRAQAPQVVVVDAAGTRATITPCERTADGRYVAAFGSFTGWVGRNGVAPKNAKREGDGRTPSGTYPLTDGFGAGPNPGLDHHSWLDVDARDVWVDDPDSALYNRHARLPVRGRWDSAERLQIPAYAYAQVIDHNAAAVPGHGSAIFLHLSQGRPTAGCVAVGERKLLRLLRWQRDGVLMRITR